MQTMQQIHHTRLPRRLIGLAMTCLASQLWISPPDAQAHETSEHCTAVMSSVALAGFSDSVSVECIDGHAIIRGDTYPDHSLMTGIVGSNEQVPVPAPDYFSPIPLAPETVPESVPHTRDAALGVAVNGVPIYDYTAGGELSQQDLAVYQAELDTVATHQLDECGGHAGRGDDYHYHTRPDCMIEQMNNAGADAIIGWAFDGYPLYADLNPDGTPIAEGELDICNGQPDDVFGYRYHTSDEAPYIIQCLTGKAADMRSLPRVSPLASADGGRGPEPGRPPRGGVDDLVFTQTADGVRSMNYRYQGKDYFISYRPSEQKGCYHFQSRTVTNEGELFEQELCR